MRPAPRSGLSGWENHCSQTSSSWAAVGAAPVPSSSAIASASGAYSS